MKFSYYHQLSQRVSETELNLCTRIFNHRNICSSEPWIYSSNQVRWNYQISYYFRESTLPRNDDLAPRKTIWLKSSCKPVLYNKNKGRRYTFVASCKPVLYNKNSYKVEVKLLCQPLLFSHKHYNFAPKISNYGTKKAGYIISLTWFRNEN